MGLLLLAPTLSSFAQVLQCRDAAGVEYLQGKSTSMSEHCHSDAHASVRLKSGKKAGTQNGSFSSYQVRDDERLNLLKAELEDEKRALVQLEHIKSVSVPENLETVQRKIRTRRENIAALDREIARTEKNERF
jgi:hypothetical protein